MYENRAYEKQTDFGPEPVVVIVVTGTHDTSRLVHLMARGTIEQIQVADKLVRQLRRRNGGRAALELLRAHGGPDLVSPPPAEIDCKKVAYWGSFDTMDFVSASPDGKVDTSYAPFNRRMDPDTARRIAEQLWAAADYAEKAAPAVKS
jgi:hypothetical protein